MTETWSERLTRSLKAMMRTEKTVPLFKRDSPLIGRIRMALLYLQRRARR